MVIIALLLKHRPRQQLGKIRNVQAKRVPIRIIGGDGKLERLADWYRVDWLVGVQSERGRSVGGWGFPLVINRKGNDIVIGVDIFQRRVILAANIIGVRIAIG